MRGARLREPIGRVGVLTKQLIVGQIEPWLDLVKLDVVLSRSAGFKRRWRCTRQRDELGFGIADALRDAVATIVACSISSASFGETLVGYRGPSGEQIDEVANRCEVGSQCFAGAFVERSDWPLDGLAGDYFDFFVFHFAFSCEAIWFLQPGQRNQSPSPQGNAEVYEAGAEGNGRDRSGVHLARPVLAEAVWVK